MLQTQSVKSVGANLVLKHATVEDAPRLNAFYALIFDPYVGVQTEAMMRHHPTIRPEHFIYIEDSTTGQIVSSLCLLPWGESRSLLAVLFPKTNAFIHMIY